MITAVRTAGVHDGKFADAVAWALKTTNYLRDKLGGNTQLMRNVGGPLYQLHWVTTHSSLADFEKELKRMEADEGYKTLVKEARQQGLFIAASIVESLYESIPLAG